MLRDFIDKYGSQHPLLEFRSHWAFMSSSGLRPCARIIAEVASKHGTTPERIKGRCRQVAVCAARAEAIERMREEEQKSYPEIGQILGRDHSTIYTILKNRRDGK